MGVASLANWSFDVLRVFSFPLMATHLGLGGLLAIYRPVCIAGIAFTPRVMPETGGVPLENIERHPRSGRLLRTLGRARSAPAARWG
ncbi:MFS transporter [Xanthobacter sediminis]